MRINYILFILILSSLSALPVSAFSDGFQDHPSDDLTQGDVSNMWVTTSTAGVVNVVQYTKPYNKALHLQSSGSCSGACEFSESSTA